MPPAQRPSADPDFQARQVVRGLKRLYPQVVCALVHDNPFQLLVATILSAQCTDRASQPGNAGLVSSFP